MPITAPANPATTAPSLRAPLAIAIACFVVWGLAYGLLDVLNKHFQESLHIGKAQSSWLQTAYFGAYLTMSVPAGMLLQSKGYRFGIVTGLLVTATGALCFIPAQNFAAFVAAMFVLASGLCCLETAADTYVSVLGDPRNASGRLNLAQSFNALGVFLGPLIGGALLFHNTQASGESNVQRIYLGIAIAVLAFAGFVARAHLPEPAIPTAAQSAIPGTQKSLWKQRNFVLGVITQALYVGAQVGIGAFFINLVTETWPGLTSRQGAFLLSIGAALNLIGRFATTALLLRFPARAILILYGTANILLCLVVAAAIPIISALALTAAFFFMSAMFATIFAIGVGNLGAATKRGASIMVMAIGGGVLLPYPMGQIADAWGTPRAFLLPALCFTAVAVFGWRSGERV